MPDRKLLDSDILEEGDMWLIPFNQRCVRPAGYDIGVGEWVRLWIGGKDEDVRLDPKNRPYVTIPPDATCEIQSLEMVRMPLNMSGRLSLRNGHSKYLDYNGGPIDPGYNGHLVFPIKNRSDTPVQLRYGEPLVSAEFFKHGKPVEEAYQRTTANTNQANPTLAAVPFDRVRLTREQQEQKKTLEEIEKKVVGLENAVQVNRLFLERVVLVVVIPGSIASISTMVSNMFNSWSQVLISAFVGLGAYWLYHLHSSKNHERG